jgi:hypothetical protein
MKGVWGHRSTAFDSERDNLRAASESGISKAFQEKYEYTCYFQTQFGRAMHIAQAFI